MGFSSEWFIAEWKDNLEFDGIDEVVLIVSPIQTNFVLFTPSSSNACAVDFYYQKSTLMQAPDWQLQTKDSQQMLDICSITKNLRHTYQCPFNFCSHFPLIIIVDFLKCPELYLVFSASVYLYHLQFQSQTKEEQTKLVYCQVSMKNIY